MFDLGSSRRGWRVSRTAVPSSRRARRAVSVCQLVRAAGRRGRREYPQTGQVARPVAGSISRKLGQPLVLQKVRLAAFATEARRRSRRMEDARPAKVVVAERVIIWCVFWFFLARRWHGSPAAAVAVTVRSGQPGWRPERVMVRAANRERQFLGRSTGAVATDRLHKRLCMRTATSSNGTFGSGGRRLRFRACGLGAGGYDESDRRPLPVRAGSGERRRHKPP